MENQVTNIESFNIGMLQTVPCIFKNFGPDDLRGILETARIETLDEDIKLNPKSEHQTLDGYLVVEGKLAAQRHGKNIELYNPGDFIGEAFVHSRVFIDCDLVTLEPCKLLVFDRESTLYYFRDKPEKLLKIFTINVVEAQQKHIFSLFKRIAAFMLKNEEL